MNPKSIYLAVPHPMTEGVQLLDLHLETGLIEATGLVALGRSVDRKCAAGLSTGTEDSAEVGI